jgi:RNA polymerase sigma-70 factor (ECF subfamily)
VENPEKTARAVKTFDVLAVEAQRGDRVALRELLRGLGPMMVRTATTILGSRTDAEDIVQESMLVLARSLGDLRETRAIVAYTKRIVVRTAIRARRRAGPIPETLDGIAGLAGASASQPIEDSLEHRQHVERALALLDRLPEEQAEVMLMHLVEGHTVAEVAEAMGVSFHTITSRIRLAKQHLERMRTWSPPRLVRDEPGRALS